MKKVEVYPSTKPNKEVIMGKSIVSIAKGTNVEKMVEEVLEPLGGVKNLIKRNSTVVLKPNAGHVAPPESSVNTNPELVAAVIKEVRKAEPKEIILAEASAIGCDTMECLEASGILKAAQDAGIDRVIDIKQNKDLINLPIRDARSDLTKVRIPRFLLEAEHIINLPIFKSHCSMVFTCALKNLKGIVQDKVHYQMHQTDLAKAMMDLWSVVKADLNIADVIRPAEGFGPHSTIPIDFGCIVAGKDPVAVDATVCRMVGLDINKVAYFEPARERGLGNFEEDLIEVRGKSIDEVYKPLWLPYLEGLEKYSEYKIDTEGACSSCLSLVALTMEKLKSLGEYEKNTDAIIFVGRKKELPQGLDPKKVILIGDCLKKYRKYGVFAGGCPPAEPHPLWAIVDRKDYTEIGPGLRERMAKEAPYFEAHMQKLLKERDKSV
ncbi:MAG: hypothetical protein DRN81_06330 [Thermoproteota archaeon]|nr:MAG: hypothetical protein DRN81_06330 [Candidatus Korarchaeota archaeon]